MLVYSGPNIPLEKFLPYYQECPKNIPKNDYKYDRTTRTKYNASRDLPECRALYVNMASWGT